MPPQIYSYAEADQLAAALGQYILAAQADALRRGDKFKIAVSGGSLGAAMKKALIDNADVAPSVQWDRWEVYFSDERLVPTDHADSNYGLFVASVVNHLHASKPQLFTIDESLLTGKDGLFEDADLRKDEKIAERYAQLLPADAKLDLILLGCGPDGHTCSLFPGHPLLAVTDRTVVNIWDSPKPPARRITVTFPVLEKAARVAFVAEGEGKAPILKQIFTDASSQLPSKLVNDKRDEVAWFVSESALHGVDVLASKY